jgi:thiamine-phosphate pyrophosphorylase
MKPHSNWRPRAVPLDPKLHFPVMCLTQDGLGIPHALQAERLCAAGARWIQLRTKTFLPAEWHASAVATAEACRRHGSLFIVNDSVDLALASGADGVHLGRLDSGWTEARRRLGPDLILGGTVNDAGDARRAVESGCLDYVGVGPLRFTPTKTPLAPALGFEGILRLLNTLRGLPAWVIGGVVPLDLPKLRRGGAAGVAVSSSLYRDGRLEDNFRALLEAWTAHAEALWDPLLR